jgi:GT2 family glycosyltransferase
MISVILTSIRPQNFKWSLNCLLRSQEGIDFEVLCATDFPIEEGPKVKWVHTPERKGVINAICQAEKIAQSEYVYITNDQSMLSPRALEHLETFCKSRDNLILTGPKDFNNFQFKYYDRWFVAYPFLHRKIIDMLGGIFDPVYGAFFADPDLSLRAHQSGIPVLDCSGAMNVRVQGLMDYTGHVESKHKFYDADKAIFTKRWEHLGAYQDCK